MISVSDHQRVGFEGDGSFNLAAEVGGVGVDVELIRGVSGISRGGVVAEGCCLVSDHACHGGRY